MPNWTLKDTAVVWDEDAPDPEPDEVDAEPDETFDPADHTVDEVKAWVEANPDYVTEVLEAEEGGKNRVTLVDWLNEFGTE
jgi:hypothetical protein